MQIIRLHLQGGAVNVTDCDWNVILDKTQGFSGSDLATLVMNALFEPLRELKNTVCWTETEGINIRSFLF